MNYADSKGWLEALLELQTCCPDWERRANITSGFWEGDVGKQGKGKLTLRLQGGR